jgi:hypothetical protein
MAERGGGGASRPPKDIVLAFPARVTPIRHVRSTLLMGTMTALKGAGYFDTWTQALPPAHRDVLLRAVAGTWIPTDTAMAHYVACDSLNLSADVEAQLGGATFDRVRGTLLGTMVRMANGAGVTPWTLLSQIQRFWDRAYDGAGIQVLRLGPKDAQVDIAQCPFADTHYHRNALRGVFRAVLLLFCRQAYVLEPKAHRAPGTYRLRAQWV